MSNDEQRAQHAAAARGPDTDPGLLRFTEALTATSDVRAASGIADMLLIFLSAGGTILGSMLSAILFLFFTPARTHDAVWITWAILSVAGGGIIGCLTVMAVLNARQLIEFERKLP